MACISQACPAVSKGTARQSLGRTYGQRRARVKTGSLSGLGARRRYKGGGVVVCGRGRAIVVPAFVAAVNELFASGICQDQYVVAAFSPRSDAPRCNSLAKPNAG